MNTSGDEVELPKERPARNTIFRDATITVVVGVLTTVLGAALIGEGRFSTLFSAPQRPTTAMEADPPGEPNDLSQPSGSAPATVELSRWEMGKDFDVAMYDLGEKTDTFGPDDEVYIMLWTDSKSEGSAAYRAEWLNPEGMTEMREEGTVTPGQSIWYLRGQPARPQWTPGTYTVRMYVEDTLFSEWSFNVVEN